MVDLSYREYFKPCLGFWFVVVDELKWRGDFKPNCPGTWFSVISAWRNARYQNFRLTCFSVINSLAICIKVRHVHSANPFQYWRPLGAVVMLEPFNIIHRMAFSPISFLSKSEWNRWGRHPTSTLNCSSAEVLDVDDIGDILHIQQYLVAMSTIIREYRYTPKATQSPNTMSIWTLSRYMCRFLMGFPLGGLAMVVK